ncbi:hypothetical protein CONPUDRAFT_76933 [Coniophora puteana RWD-64-598 SS2]|uniref:Uncharacterized protein n=1 Tax=Coniophora puteana (strain RWD-64-598) TaxID=741705 RepID=A0A5M3M9B9_CONPW|nr:uncharacterized protein CONPUDRAFT_76933 [Coniophora puteana RWD-64-598 SS2]EIW75882.1 hypothetical protein CONPUDRAFT_76933 [Coniophora puteana RWD-64-598 SS2]
MEDSERMDSMIKRIRALTQRWVRTQRRRTEVDGESAPLSDNVQGTTISYRFNGATSIFSRMRVHLTRSGEETTAIEQGGEEQRESYPMQNLDEPRRVVEVYPARSDPRYLAGNLPDMTWWQIIQVLFFCKAIEDVVDADRQTNTTAQPTTTGNVNQATEPRTA